MKSLETHGASLQAPLKSLPGSWTSSLGRSGSEGDDPGPPHNLTNTRISRQRGKGQSWGNGGGNQAPTGPCHPEL